MIISSYNVDGGVFVKNKVMDSPNWMFEAASCITDLDQDRAEAVLENSSRFGMTREEMYEVLKDFIEYKKLVSAEIMPIYKDFRDLDKYFKETNFTAEITNPVAPTLTMYFGSVFPSIDDKKTIDKVITEIIEDVISELSPFEDGKNIEIKSIEDILSLTNNISMEDSSKLILIDLYYNRYKIYERLKTLLNLCAPICKKYFYIIQDEFSKTANLVKNTENIQTLFQDNPSVKLNLVKESEIYIAIFFFNSFSIIEGQSGFLIYIGMYFFEYLKLRNKTRFDDTQVIADLKALGDTTRLKIIHLLAQKKMYVQELSEALSLTPATVSHHINTLLKSELITITLDTERPKTIYYELNQGKICDLGDTIKSLAGRTNNE